MCVAVVAIETSPEFPLIILHNRDEFFSRKSLPAAYWSENASIFAGQDQLAGGSWFGCNREGGFALITNYRDPQRRREGAASRGEIVRKFLQDSEPEAFRAWIESERAGFNPFNLVFGLPGHVYYCSDSQQEPVRLENGIYGLSNARLDTPWYKLERAKSLFRENLAGGLPDKDALLEAFLDETKCPRDALPNTGISPELEYQLSSIFVTGEQYGTRATSLLTIESDGRLAFEELLHAPLRKAVNRHGTEFLIDPRTT